MITVAIVEDDDIIRQALEAIINHADHFHCTGAYSNAEDACRKIPAALPDVVLMDIHLPGMNGIDCVAALKSKHASVQFVMLTVYEDAEKIFKAIQAGATGYLLKKTSGPKLLEAIADVYNGGSPMSSQIARKVIAAFQRMIIEDPTQQLSRREKEVLDLLMQGFRYKEIADKLFLSNETIRTHIRNIYEKLQVHSLQEALNKVNASKKPL